MAEGKPSNDNGCGQAKHHRVVCQARKIAEERRNCANWDSHMQHPIVVQKGGAVMKWTDRIADIKGGLVMLQPRDSCGASASSASASASAPASAAEAPGGGSREDRLEPADAINKIEAAIQITFPHVRVNNIKLRAWITQSCKDENASAFYNIVTKLEGQRLANSIRSRANGYQIFPESKNGAPKQSRIPWEYLSMDSKWKVETPAECQIPSARTRRSSDGRGYNSAYLEEGASSPKCIWGSPHQ